MMMMMIMISLLVNEDQLYQEILLVYSLFLRTFGQIFAETILQSEDPQSLFKALFSGFLFISI